MLLIGHTLHGMRRGVEPSNSRQLPLPIPPLPNNFSGIFSGISPHESVPRREKVQRLMRMEPGCRFIVRTDGGSSIGRPARSVSMRPGRPERCELVSGVTAVASNAVGTGVPGVWGKSGKVRASEVPVRVAVT